MTAMGGVEVPSKPYRRQVMVAERMAGFPELIVDGRATSMDIDALSPGRFARGTAAAEATMF
jgi:hypothetical protein